MSLSQHFGLHEFLRSGTAARMGIDMTPPPEVVNNLRRLCVNVLEPLRVILDRPIAITSGYRPPALNAAIGGAKNSQHVLGEAADIIVVGMSPHDVWASLRAADIKFDQAIEEFNQWTHVSYREGRCREQSLLAQRKNGRVQYTDVTLI